MKKCMKEKQLQAEEKLKEIKESLEQSRWCSFCLQCSSPSFFAKHLYPSHLCSEKFFPMEAFFDFPDLIKHLYNKYEYNHVPLFYATCQSCHFIFHYMIIWLTAVAPPDCRNRKIRAQVQSNCVHLIQSTIFPTELVHNNYLWKNETHKIMS